MSTMTQNTIPQSSMTARQSNPIPMKAALLFWLKLGFMSFGGPAGQIAILHQELVEKRRWISESRFLHALNYCMLLPGPEAQQLATYLGWLMHKTFGGILAGTLFILPSLLLLIGLGWLYQSYGQLPIASAVLYGIKPAVTAIVLAAAYRIGIRTLNNALLRAIALASLVSMWVFKLAFPWIVLSAACIGALAGRKMPERFQTHSLHALNSSDQPPAIIDDNTPPPAHARFNRGKLVQILLSGAILWSGAMAILWKIYGWEGALTQMAWFFTKAALLTFGGAYAVLPYVYQGAVEQFHWLTAAQMMDGLALGETTPGPLVMVISFAGFIAGWGQAILGEEHLFLSGALTACVVTYFTFLPSFLFILAGGPLVESSHGNVKWNAPLTSISAAVVGVIVNLAVFFGKQVFWPQGWESSADVVAIAMSSIAFFALTRLKLGIISVIVMAATMGALFKHEWFFTGLSFY